MISMLYSIYDRGVQSFAAPVLASSETQIKRSLLDLFTADSNRPVLERSPLVRYPEDYDLYYLGLFDTEKGELRPVEVIQRVCSLVEFTIGG
nr:MAG: nonstructural protein [Microvirus sp.]